VLVFGVVFGLKGRIVLVFGDVAARGLLLNCFFFFISLFYAEKISEMVSFMSPEQSRKMLGSTSH